MEPLVELKEVRMSYPVGEERESVLRGINLTVEPGSIVAVMGKSGSGKSTLLNLIAGLDVPDEGTVTVVGESLTDRSERARTRLRRKNIGMVFQFFNLVPSLTVRENLIFPLELNGLPVEERPERMMDRLDLGNLADRYPSSLSGGERQRTAVGRALIHDPSLILADEPTGNLDHDLSRRVLDRFRELCQDRDVGVVLATHSEMCASISHRRYQLRSGRLHEST